MEPAIDVTAISSLRRPLTFRDFVVLACYERIQIMPCTFQVDLAMAIDSNQDVVCTAGTGSGKSLAFVLIHFFRPDVITWIVSPLNVIENQMADIYTKYGLTAVAVNAFTLTSQLIEEINKGAYQVVISSPESYLDKNKLRQCLLSESLAHKKQVTIVDEAHCVTTWGNSGFRKDFMRIGYMRVWMNPDNSPMCAATATLAANVEPGVLRSLQIKPDHLDINLGCWRKNLRYGVRVMHGGQESYSEACQFFDPTICIEDTPQAIVFVESCEAAHHGADATRSHFKLSGQDAIDFIPVYHALMDDVTKRRIERRFRQGKARIIWSSEALTMGIDFGNLYMTINFLAPLLLETLLQRFGRTARDGQALGLCYLLVTRGIVSKAFSICKKAGITFDSVVGNIKTEDGNQGKDEPEPSIKSSGTTTEGSKRTMSLEMAQFIASGVSGVCLTDLVDRIFKNPAHTPCYEIGGCEPCHRRRLQETASNRRQQQEGTCSTIQDTKQDPERTHKIPKPCLTIRPTAEQERFLKGILDWRRQKFLDVYEVHDTSLDRIMTLQEANRIAKSYVKTPDDFNQPDIHWLGEANWRLELCTILLDLQRHEDQLAKEAIRIQAEAARTRAEENHCAYLQRRSTVQTSTPNQRRKPTAAKRQTKKLVALASASKSDVVAPHSTSPSAGYDSFWSSFTRNPSCTPIKATDTHSGAHGLRSPVPPVHPTLPLPSSSLNTSDVTMSTTQPIAARAVGRMLIAPSSLSSLGAQRLADEQSTRGSGK